MTYEIVPYEAQPLAERWNYAEMLSQAGDLIPKSLHNVIRDPETNAAKGYAPSPGKVMLVLEVGASLGLHPTAALANVYVIEGRVSMSAQLMVAVIRRAGHRIRVETSGTWAAGDFEAVATLLRTDDQDHEYRVVWTKDRAERAGLLGKDNWKHYPEALCVARATTEVVRQGGSDVVLGIGYTPEELGATVDASGGMLTLEQLEQEPATAEEEAKPTPTARARKTPTKGRQGTKRAPKDAEPAPAPEGAPEGSVGGDVEAVEPVNPPDAIATPGEVAVVIEAGVPIADGPMAGLIPTEAQVAAAEQMRALQEQGTDASVAERIMATEIPAEPEDEYQAPADDDGPAVLASASTGEIADAIDSTPQAETATAPADANSPEVWAEWAWTEAHRRSKVGADEYPHNAELAVVTYESARSRADMMALWQMAEARGVLTTELRMGLINAGKSAQDRADQAAAR